MTGKIIGYIRVSTFEQNPERQLEGIVFLTDESCILS